MSDPWGKRSPTETPADSGGESWWAFQTTVGNGQGHADQTATDRSTSAGNTGQHTACRFTCRTCFGRLWFAICATTLGVATLII